MHAFPGHESQPLAQFAEKAYLDYSMYVILDRALPHIGDGLKPVQRRIVYAMSELGLAATAKYKKSARTVGDVLGKFHPHGDSACYEAMVLMAQPFSYRYPLIDGQGNWGSIDDPKSFAAMRYTESRLSRYAALLLDELGQGTVDWGPNFDGTLEEPMGLPARLPNLLLNGTTGIAVGMATDVPPHNLREVAAALALLLENPDSDDDALFALLPGPDLPTGGEIVSPAADLRALWNSGLGSYRVRARYHVEDDGDIVIDELPYQVSSARMLEQVAAQMQAKKLPLLEDLRDESDHENPVRLVLVPRSKRVEVEPLMAHLFATTDLERSYRVNINVIGLNGRPKVRGIRALLEEWLVFRVATVERRLRHRLARIEDRLEVLAGLLIAFLNIDEVIRIIRENDKPRPVLMERFAISERQAEAILELKLRHLARLEEMKIRGEETELGAERDRIAATLADAGRLRALVRDEILADAEAFGDLRRSRLIERRAARAIDETALLPSEPVTVVLSEAGFIRAAKGHDVDARALGYRAGDALLAALATRSNRSTVVFDDHGRGYTLANHTLPSARGQGEPLTGRFQPPPGARFRAMIGGADEDGWWLANSAGFGFVLRLADATGRVRAGKQVFTLGDAAWIVPVTVPSEPHWAACLSSGGRLLLFPFDELPQLARGKGNRLMKLSGTGDLAGETLQAVAVLRAADRLVVHTEKQFKTLTPEDLTAFVGKRASRGALLPRGFRTVRSLEVVDASTATRD